MDAYLFTNKFKIGDEVKCIKANPRYPTAYIQTGDFGTVIEIWGKGYVVRKRQDSKLSLGKLIEKRKEECFMYECEIDFADIDKRQPVEVKPVRVKRIPPPGGGKDIRLKLIKARGKIYNKRLEGEKLLLSIEEDKDGDRDYFPEAVGGAVKRRQAEDRKREDL